MIYDYTEEQLAVKEAARDFARIELLPGVIERDSKMIVATEQIKMMGEMGFLGMMVSPEYGGGGMEALSYAMAMEEISKIQPPYVCPLIILWSVQVLKNTVMKNKNKNTSLN